MASIAVRSSGLTLSCSLCRRSCKSLRVSAMSTSSAGVLPLKADRRAVAIVPFLRSQWVWGIEF
jgi:hypothetical protein